MKKPDHEELNYNSLSQQASSPSMSRLFAGTHPGDETWRTAVGGRHFHLAPSSLRLLVTEPDRWGRTAVRRHSGPVPRGRAVSGQRGAAASSALLLLVLDGRLKSYNHTYGWKIYIPLLGCHFRFADSPDLLLFFLLWTWMTVLHPVCSAEVKVQQPLCMFYMPLYVLTLHWPVSKECSGVVDLNDLNVFAYLVASHCLVIFSPMFIFSPQSYIMIMCNSVWRGETFTLCIQVQSGNLPI